MLGKNSAAETQPNGEIAPAIPGRDDIQKIPDAIDSQTQRILLAIWLTAIEKINRTRFVVPAKFCWLPCGCTRERGFENEINSRWIIKTSKDRKTYTHNGCDKTFSKPEDN